MLEIHTSVGFVLRTGINQQTAQIMMMMMMKIMPSGHVLAAIRHLSDGMGEQTRFRYR